MWACARVSLCASNQGKINTTAISNSHEAHCHRPKRISACRPFSVLPCRQSPDGTAICAIQRPTNGTAVCAIQRPAPNGTAVCAIQRHAPNGTAVCAQRVCRVIRGQTARPYSQKIQWQTDNMCVYSERRRHGAGICCVVQLPPHAHWIGHIIMIESRMHQLCGPASSTRTQDDKYTHSLGWVTHRLWALWNRLSSAAWWCVGRASRVFPVVSLSATCGDMSTRPRVQHLPTQPHCPAC